MAALLLACTAIAGALAGCGESSTLRPLAQRAPLTSSDAARARRAGGPSRLFSARSFWNQRLAPDAALDPASTPLVDQLDAQIAGFEAREQGPWINTRSWSVPIYTVAASQPSVRVRLVGAFRERTLQSAWNAVPLPPAARPALGRDAHLVVWQPSRDRLWEFWHLSRGVNGWSAAWGGAMRHVSESPGVYGSRAWPGAKPWWGASASSLSIAGGLITLDDLEGGSIDHALAISIPEVRAGVYSSPARRDDGQSADPLSLPEGARLRLPANLDLQSLHLPALTLEIARAAQRYGLIVRDRSYVPALFAQDPSSTGSEPYAGAGGYFEGHYPNQLLASFPWADLQVLALRLHPNGSGSRRAPATGAGVACTTACEASGGNGR
jgi:hypothetical protein